MSSTIAIASSLPDSLRNGREAVRRVDLHPRHLPSSNDQPTPSVSQASLRLLQPTKPAWLERDTAVALIFALKTFAASLLALAIAFWAGLDDPRWAFLTVFVVSQPDSGLVLAKSFYRILGTIAGLLVTVAFVFAFAQYGELFLGALAIWILVCNLAAQSKRNFASYGFQLAGYTAAIVGLPAALNPNAAYPLVVARGTEILLGIGCAVLVSRLLFTRELSSKLVMMSRALVQRADRFVSRACDAGSGCDQALAERTGLVGQYLQFAALQNAARFESADTRVQVDRLCPVTDAAMQLCATVEAASQRFELLSQAGRSPSDNGSSSTSAAASDSRATLLAAMVRDADDREILAARSRLRDSLAAFERGSTVARPRRASALWSDPVSAMVSGLRAALAVAISATIWFATAWPNGPAAVVVAAVLCSLLASLPNPQKLTIAAGAVVITAAVLSFATQFYLLPLAVDFPSMALALAPIVLTCSFLMAQPQIGTFGLVAIVYFAFSSNIDNVMTYDAAATLNASFSVLAGIGVALILFAVFFPETPGFVRERFGRQAAEHLRPLITAQSCGWNLEDYRLALYERLGQALGRLKEEPAAMRECMAAAGAALSLAQSVARLRACTDAEPVSGVAGRAARLLEGLSNALQSLSPGKLIAIEQDARLLANDALNAVDRSSDAERLQAVAVACCALGADVLAVRTLLEEKTHASRA